MTILALRVLVLAFVHLNPELPRHETQNYLLAILVQPHQGSEQNLEATTLSKVNFLLKTDIELEDKLEKFKHIGKCLRVLNLC